MRRSLRPDPRLALELLPGVVFVAVNVVAGLLAGAAAATAATIAATALRWRWDRRIPWLAVTTLLVALALLGVSLALGDETFVKMRATIGGLAFAVILAVGASLRPSLLSRSLGYRLRMSPAGWRVLHAAWIGIALLLAAVNEAVWRTTPTDVWVGYAAVNDPAVIALYWWATHRIATRYWDDDG